MRKVLIMILIVILLAGLGLMLVQGINIGKFQIKSIPSIIDDNKQLDQEIATLSDSIDTGYEAAKASLQNSFQLLMKNKQEYQDQLLFSTEEEIKAANKTEGYKLDYLWTKIGFYATKNKLTMQATVTKAGTGANQYDMYDITLTANGDYIAISEFIYAIENDSNLGFKIEEFKMLPYTTSVTDDEGNAKSQEALQATFVIKNVLIDKDSITVVQPNTPSSDGATSTSATNSEQAGQNPQGAEQLQSTPDGQ